MSRLMMGFPIILVLMFFTGTEVEASPLNRCYEMVRFTEDIDSYIDSYIGSFMKVENKETLKLFCTNVTRYFMCISDVLQEITGFTLREMANAMEGTDEGEYPNLLIKMEESVEEMCTIGIQLQSDSMSIHDTGLEMDFPCFERGRMIPVKHCILQSLDGYIEFKYLQPARELSKADNECIMKAFVFGCVAATLREECGEETFNRYKTGIKKTGFFNNGTCSIDLKQSLKTTLLGFDMGESRENLYRAILDLKRRRK